MKSKCSIMLSEKEIVTDYTNKIITCAITNNAMKSTAPALNKFNYDSAGRLFWFIFWAGKE
jgi:hypothetical protein